MKHISLFEDFTGVYTLESVPDFVKKFISNWIWQQPIPYEKQVGEWFKSQNLVPKESIELYRGITAKEYKDSDNPESWSSDERTAKMFAKGLGNVMPMNKRVDGIVVKRTFSPDEVIVDLKKFLDKCDRNLRYRLGAEDIDDEHEYIVLNKPKKVHESWCEGDMYFKKENNKK